MNVYSQLSESQALTLTSAVLLYTAPPQSEWQFRGKDAPGQALAMVCDAVPVPGKAPVLGAGRMLTQDTLESLLRSLNGLPRTRQMISEHILLADGGRLAWWTPSARRPLFVKAREGSLGSSLAGKTPWHPALLFIAEAGRLCIHALADSARPGPKTPLFVAPYFNLWQGGHMCNGNVRLPQSLAPDSIPMWEKAFFETTFTHPSVKKLTSHKGGHDGLWRECAKENCTSFPSRYLTPQTSLPMQPGGVRDLRTDKGQVTAEEAVCQ